MPQRKRKRRAGGPHPGPTVPRAAKKRRRGKKPRKRRRAGAKPSPGSPRYQ